MNKIKVKISEKAYEEILNLLSLHKEYTHLRLEKGSCCRNKVSLTLDTSKMDDIEDSIEDLKLIYSNDLSNLLKEVVIVYRNNSFMVKASNIDNSKSFCSNCTKSNNNCSNCNKYIKEIKKF